MFANEEVVLWRTIYRRIVREPRGVQTSLRAIKANAPEVLRTLTSSSAFLLTIGPFATIVYEVLPVA